MQHDIQHEYVIMPDNYVNIRLDVVACQYKYVTCQIIMSTC